MLNASELAAVCDAEVIGPRGRRVAAVAPVEFARLCDLTWIGDSSRLDQVMATCGAGVVLVQRGAKLPDCDATFLVCRDLLSARVSAIEALERSAAETARGLGFGAVDSSAELASDVVVSPFSVIGALTKIGAGVWIGPNCVIGPGVDLGRGCHLGAGSIIGAGTRLGAECLIGAGAIVGSQPDAYDWRDGGMRPAPAIGVVILEDRVRVGPATLIQRGVERPTIVGANTMIGSQCLIGHDSRVGQHCAIGAQSGLAASCVIGDHVMISVQVGISIGVHVGDRARIGPKAGVMSSVPAGETWLGSPAIPKMNFLRQQAGARREMRRPAVNPNKTPN